MVTPLYAVNGLAVEILFFLKKMDAKDFVGPDYERRLIPQACSGGKIEFRISKLETNSNSQIPSFET
jgi:hypothetical protein